MRNLIQTVMVSTLVATSILIFSSPRVQSSMIIVEKQYILATDSQRINLFISELLTPKSAACFRAILNHESHMNPFAKNPFSTASGVSQLLDSTYQNLGMKKTTDGLAQVVATLSYISRRYGGRSSTCNAWHYWQKHFNY